MSTPASSDPPCQLKTVRSKRDKKEQAFVESQGKKTSRKVSLNEDSEEEDADKSYEGESPVVELNRTSKQPEKPLSRFGKTIELGKQSVNIA
jgi:hypothetical protein